MISNRSKNRFHFARRTQRGLTLVELMVGITIGLLVSVAAIGTLAFMQSGNRVSGETTRMQQDAMLAFNLIGQYVRGAGAVDLTSPNNNATTLLTDNTVFIGIPTNTALTNLSDGPTISNLLVFGNRPSTGPQAGQDILWLARSLPLPTNTTPVTPQLDCLGNNVAGKAALITRFDVNQGQLRCGRAGYPSVITPNNQTIPVDIGAAMQPIIANVLQFVVHYGITDPTNATPQLVYRDVAGMQTAISAALPNWPDVRTIRVCLLLTSQGVVSEFNDVYFDSKKKAATNMPFMDCNGVNIGPTTVALDPQRRMFRVYRQVFSIRPFEPQI